MPTPCPPSVVEHTDIIWGIMTIAITGFSYMIWRMLTRMETKLDDSVKAHVECQKTLPQLFLLKEDFRQFRDELRNDRVTRWKELSDRLEKILSNFWNHKHDSNGLVALS